MLSIKNDLAAVKTTAARSFLIDNTFRSWQLVNLLYQACIAGFVKHLSLCTGHNSVWIMAYALAFAHGKWITEYCSLRVLWTARLPHLIRAVAEYSSIARAYSSSKKLELYFWARVLDNFFANAKQRLKTGKPLAQTFVTQLRDKFSLAWDDANQFRDCPGHTVGYLGNVCNELA